MDRFGNDVKWEGKYREEVLAGPRRILWVGCGDDQGEGREGGGGVFHHRFSSTGRQLGELLGSPFGGVSVLVFWETIKLEECKDGALEGGGFREAKCILQMFCGDASDVV